MTTCQHCGSDRVINKGFRNNVNSVKKRFLCKDCGKSTYFTLTNFSPSDEIEDDHFYWENRDIKQTVKDHDIFVISSAQNDTKTFKPFFDSLKNYCDYRSAALFVIPNRYWNRTLMTDPTKYTWDQDLYPYLIENEVRITDKLKIVANVNIVATAVNPLSGLDPITQGDTTIVGHPQLQQSTVPVSKHVDPVILTTTGSLSLDSEKGYTDSKAGYKAQHVHTNSAIVVEVDRQKNQFHLRQLVASEDGTFYDWMGKFVPHQRYPEEFNRVEALVTGDEHVHFMSEIVRSATYDRKDSILKTLKPKNIVRHDVLDSFAVSHHHRNNTLQKYYKHRGGEDNLEDELTETANFIRETTPEDSQTFIIQSNHNEHFTRWLNEADPKKEPWNAKLYHEMMFEAMDEIDAGLEEPDPLEIWCRKRGYTDFDFLYVDDTHYIEDILITMHGDRGPNGSRGSRKNLSKLSDRSIIGHAHSPGIEKNCWQVGISAEGMSYNKGPSGWMHTHAVIYPGGQIQLINIIRGSWRLDQ